MSIGAGFYLGFMALVFVLWAITMFRLLWKIKQAKDARAKEQGRAQFGLHFDLSMETISLALTAPEYAPDRKRLFILTPLIVGLIAAGPFVLPMPN